MKNKSKKQVANVVAEQGRLEESQHFEVVDNALVSADFMRALSCEVDEKISLYSDVIKLPELLANFYDSMSRNEREVVGACIVKLIEQRRIALHPDSR